MCSEIFFQEELDGQKRALQSSLQYRQWTHENSSHKEDRLTHGDVPYLGGMPQEDEELMNCMLDAGFDPRSNAFLKRIAYDMKLRKCQALKKKLNTKVGRSAYLYMVVDFWGVLKEDEVHIGFSTAFEADDAWSKTMVHGTDVLLARSPAHFISDIQRVKAVSDMMEKIIRIQSCKELVGFLYELQGTPLLQKQYGPRRCREDAQHTP